MGIKSLLTLILGVFTIFASARELPKKPEPAKYVNDFHGLLSAAEQESLERKLIAYYDTTSSQVVIVILSSLNDDDIFEYSHALAREWGIGQAGKNNGLLLLIAMKEREMRIHVGSGLEGSIPDAEAWEIISKVLRPHFREEKYYEGLDQATTAIFKAAAGEFKADPKDDKEKDPPIAVIIGIIIFIVLMAIFNSRRRGRGPRGWGGFFGGGYYGGGWGGSGWGGGGSGWGGGGGGSFGGGGFSGGGASGNW